ncbi:MAG: cysteine--tRNA ligase [Verrucomicrobiae bacterium]|nr:cysteine--tRNA ligase [Verrucomicrobiae bacterium]
MSDAHAPRLFDSLSREVRTVAPADGKTLRLYCCGPTVYGPAHVGNLRTFLLQDVFRRVVELSGTPTLHVRNLTDVDDKTIRQSQAEGVPLSEFTARWTARMHADAGALNILPPHHEPGAVAHIPHQIQLIQRLVEARHAYVAQDGSVYFDVSSFPQYGRLSRLADRQITTGQHAPATETDREEADEYARDSAADFALWKARKPEDGPNFWPSPWGDGRPGWHIECSAMSIEYLGDTFDVHSGGVDLIFPHHENEIAQSEAATGCTFARHWFHIAHLMVEDRKMSKSLGNLFTLDDVRGRGFSPETLRYVLISGHYRQPLNFTWDSLAAARSALARIAKLDEALAAVAPDSGPRGCLSTTLLPLGDARHGMASFAPAWDALLDDLNTPAALGRLFTAAAEVESRIRSGELPPGQAGAERGALHRILFALGLRLVAEEPPAQAPENIRALAEARWNAKQSRDFKEADRLRAEIESRGWIVRDGKEGFELNRKFPQPNA